MNNPRHRKGGQIGGKAKVAFWEGGRAVHRRKSYVLDSALAFRILLSRDMMRRAAFWCYGGQDGLSADGDTGMKVVHWARTESSDIRTYLGHGSMLIL
jgi:hypothetical protein